MFIPSRGTNYNVDINNRINLLARPPPREPSPPLASSALTAVAASAGLERIQSLSCEELGGRSPSPVMAAARHFPSPSPSPSPSSSPWLSRVCWLVVVGECATNKEVGLGSESPTKDRREVGLGSESLTKERRVWFAVDMPTAEPTRQQG